MEKTIVSYYRNVENDNFSKDYDLEKWLMQTIDPPVEWLDKVLTYRDTLDRKDKVKLPAICITARFKGVRNLKTKHELTGLICIDIDRYSKRGKKNLCIDMQKAKEFFMELPFCMFCGFSLSGDNGLYAILKIAGTVEEYFAYFQEKLARVGINIDEQCKDITRLRFFSYDPEGYFNPNATTFRIKKKETPPVVTQEKREWKSGEDKLIHCIELIERSAIDVTSNYGDWVKIAAVLNNNFGHTGLDLFHRISKFHPDYKPKDCDKKYHQCRAMSLSNLGTIFNIFSDYGIRY